RYVLFFKQQFHEWVKQNPVGRGLAWNGPQIQENGIRNIAWIWSSLLFRASPTLTAGDRRLLHRLIYIQGGFINRYMNPHKELSHNHLISEAGGLFLTGLFFSNRRRGRIWLKRAQRVFTEALHFQVHPDGVQGEFSAHYHAFVMETALQVLLFGKEAGIEFPEEFSDRIRGMLRFVVDITHPDGTLPQFGDTDNATAFALTPRRVEDRSRYRSLAATLFRDPTFLRPGDQLHAETILLLGSSARQLFDELSSPTETETCSESYYPSVNLLTREHQDTGLHDKLVYRGGGAVFPHRMGTGHNHADQGGFEYWVNGEVIYSDSGTWSYSFADSWRYFFRSAQAHNTVTVDDQDPLPVRLDRFGIPRMAPVRTSFRQQTSISSVISTTCDITVDPGWRHTRNVTHFSTGVLIIDDLVGCPGEHRLGQHFNLNGKVKLYGKSPAGVVIETGQQQLRQIWLEPVTLRQVCGGGDPPAGWHSPRYGYKVPREHLIAELLFRDQVKLTTVIAPTGIELLDADIIVIKKRNYSPRRENPGWQLEQDQL
ncbi:alginate lyase family protein, partial [bacterium]|nr:alginate lyase family protein [bacterium]